MSWRIKDYSLFVKTLLKGWNYTFIDDSFVYLKYKGDLFIFFNSLFPSFNHKLSN